MTTCHHDLAGIVRRAELAMNYIDNPQYRVGLMTLCINDDDWECRIWVKHQRDDPMRWRNPRRVWSHTFVSSVTPGKFKSRTEALKAGRELLAWCRSFKARANEYGS